MSTPLQRRVAAFVQLYGIRPTYVEVAYGIGGEDVRVVDGINVCHTSTYGDSSPMGISVGVSQHHEVARWGWSVQPLAAMPPNVFYAVSGSSAHVRQIQWLCDDHPRQSGPVYETLIPISPLVPPLAHNQLNTPSL